MAKISGLLFMVVASILGVVSYVSYAAVFFMSQSGGASLPGSIGTESFQGIDQLQWGIILGVLVLYALSGFFIGYVGALVYNILAPRIGGVEISLKEK